MCNNKNFVKSEYHFFNFSFPIAVETCQLQTKMCPLCEDCNYWELKDICFYKRIAYLFDHPGTVFYAIFMSFWGKKCFVIYIYYSEYIKKYTFHNISEEKWYFLIDFHLIFLSFFKVFLIVQRDLSIMNHSFNIIFSPHIWQKIVVQLKKIFLYFFTTG